MRLLLYSGATPVTVVLSFFAFSRLRLLPIPLREAECLENAAQRLSSQSGSVGLDSAHSGLIDGRNRSQAGSGPSPRDPFASNRLPEVHPLGQRIESKEFDNRRIESIGRFLPSVFPVFQTTGMDSGAFAASFCWSPRSSRRLKSWWPVCLTFAGYPGIGFAAASCHR
jgi:hypothetical protein